MLPLTVCLVSTPLPSAVQVCEVTYGRVQGFDALVQHFKGAKFPTKDPAALPVVFAQVGGCGVAGGGEGAGVNGEPCAGRAPRLPACACSCTCIHTHSCGVRPTPRPQVEDGMASRPVTLHKYVELQVSSEGKVDTAQQDEVEGPASSD